MTRQISLLFRMKSKCPIQLQSRLTKMTIIGNKSHADSAKRRGPEYARVRSVQPMLSGALAKKKFGAASRVAWQDKTAPAEAAETWKEQNTL